MNITIKFFWLILFLLGYSMPSPGQSGTKLKEPTYGFKSIKVEYEIRSESHGISTVGTKSLYIDQFGEKQASLIKETTQQNILPNTDNETKEELIITLSEDVYTINLKDNTGLKQNLSSIRKMGELFLEINGSKEVSRNSFTKKFVEENGGKWFGEDIFLGKKCIVFELLNVKQWNYKGLALKIESLNLGVKVTEIAKSIEENIPISPKVFEIPQGVTISSLDELYQEKAQDDETDEIDGSPIGLDFNLFKTAVSGVKMTGFSLKSCVQDGNLYMAMFYKSEHEATGIYTYPKEMFELMEKKNSGILTHKNLTIKKYPAKIIELKEEDLISRTLGILIPSKSCTIVISASYPINNDQLIQIFNQLNL